jgi:hypothetical protein
MKFTIMASDTRIVLRAPRQSTIFLFISVNFTSSKSVHLTSILILSSYSRVGLPNTLLHRGIPTNILYACLVFPSRATHLFISSLPIYHLKNGLRAYTVNPQLRNFFCFSLQTLTIHYRIFYCIVIYLRKI